MKTRVTVVALLAVATAAAAGCSETVYLGPLDVVTPATLPPPPQRAGVKESPKPRPYPVNVPRVVALSGSEAELQYPGGGLQTMPKNGTYVQLDIDNGKGALEGFIGGFVVGAGAGAVASAQGCSSAGCTGGAVVASALIAGLIGALYGATVGHRTTYVLGPRP
jgi:hypothetical protein